MLKIAALITAAALIAVSPLVWARVTAPRGSEATPAKRMLNLWLCESWKPASGSFMPWLRGRGAVYAKAHPDMLVSVTSVSPQALAYALADADTALPDAILHSAGLTGDPAAFAPLSFPEGIRAVYADACSPYALPVAAGGYLLYVNRPLLDGARIAPDAPIAELVKFQSKKSAALTLSAPRGLAPAAAFTLAQGRPPVSALAPGSMVQPDNDLWVSYALSNASLLFVGTQREYARLDTLLGAQKAFPYQARALTPAFTDQLLLLSRVDPARSHDGASSADVERKARAVGEFASLLLSGEGQAALAKAGAFSVTGQAALYPPEHPLAALESSLAGDVLVPPVFEWAKTLKAVSGEKSVSSALDALERALGKIRKD